MLFMRSAKSNKKYFLSTKGK